MPDSQITQPKRPVDTRRSQRVVVRVRIIVRRPADGDGLMSEATHSLVVNAHGALIALAMSVQPGEKLVVKNWNSAEEQECRVLRLSEERKNEVAIEFTKPAPHFWKIDFPPPDWKLLQD
jgi:hypothetical protein